VCVNASRTERTEQRGQRGERNPEIDLGRHSVMT
jgi:hypothetical protein